MTSARIAVVDDQARMGQVLAMVLRRAGHTVTPWTDPVAFVDSLDQGGVDLVLTDLKMPGLTGLQVLGHVQRVLPQVPVIVITAHGTIDTAITAMKQGAADYLQKPVDNDACRLAVARALEHTRLARENAFLRAHVQARFGLDRVVAESPAMAAVLELAIRAARSNATVLVTGESGTGKEVVAQAIHVHSQRVGGPFEAVNCKALSAGVLESELFGHDRGAFTGAERARPGLFERTQGGTLFLDEIGEIDGDFQAKLLRVLQEREVRRVGGDATRPVDVRVVAATNRDLLAEVSAGRFREDLYYRLAVIPVHIPPLRERPQDVLPLARLFLERCNTDLGGHVTGWTPEVARWLQAHTWPGNVRELMNTMERGVVLARQDHITLDDLVVATRAPAPAQEGLHAYLDRMAADRIRAALADAGGVRVDAAAALGVERTTLYRLMKRYGI
jgi:DNA-binding NtrC family response regulator